MTVVDHAPPRPVTTHELLRAATDGDQVLGVSWSADSNRPSPMRSGPWASSTPMPATRSNGPGCSCSRTRHGYASPLRSAAGCGRPPVGSVSGSSASDGGSSPSTSPMMTGSATRTSTSSRPSSTPTRCAGCAASSPSCRRGRRCSWPSFSATSLPPTPNWRVARASPSAASVRPGDVRCTCCGGCSMRPPRPHGRHGRPGSGRER